jgi:type IV secretion system protein VirB4
MPLTSLLLPAFSGLTGSLALGIAGWLGVETVREHRERRIAVPNTLADLIKWSALVAPGIVLNKNGSFQTTFRYRGPDLDSSTESELVSTSARLNNIVRRLGSGWAVYFDAVRRETTVYAQSRFPDPVSALIDEERRAGFESGEHFESTYYVTLIWMPPPLLEAAAEALFFDDDAEPNGLSRREAGRRQADRAAAEYLASFIGERQRLISQFSSLFPSVAPLDDAATLAYLHSTVSTKLHPVTVPAVPDCLDALMTDEPLTGGGKPKLGRHYLGVLSIKSFPNESFPGLLDALNRLGFAYRWVTRFICLDKSEAERQIDGFKRKWFAKRKNLSTLIKEIVTNSPSALEDSDAVNKAQDADAARQEISADAVRYGYFTQSIVVLDGNFAALEKKLLLLEREINGRGFVTANELTNLNALDAWLGSLPGHCNHNVRAPLVNTLNLAHMMPVSAVWAGPLENPNDLFPPHSPPLLTAVTNGSTPFRFTNFVGDVGHALVLGPTGAGKSVLLNAMEAQFLRYRDAQVYIFDKGGSSRITTYGVGGTFYDLGNDSGLAFQPLADIHLGTERTWASEWLIDILIAENVVVTPATKKALWEGLTSLAESPRSHRTLTGLSILVQDSEIKRALHPYTIQGAHGALLDAKHDSLHLGRWLAFEMEELMQSKAAVMPVLAYLFHRLEQRFNAAAPTLLVLDEAWLFLDHPAFAAKIREWLKVLRKKCVSVVFATQSLADVDSSAIVATIKEACLTKIYLPNASALNDDIAAIYRKFGLNDRQLRILQHARPRKDYYLTSPEGNRLFDLGLGPLALAYCGATSAELQGLAKTVHAAHADDFNARYLDARANDPAPERRLPVEWAASWLRDHVSVSSPSLPDSRNSP